MNKHVCYFANANSIHTQRWVNYFAMKGWKVDLITWRPVSKSRLHPKVRLHRLFFPPHYLSRYMALIEVVRLTRKIRPSIIHAHYVNVFGIIAGLYARFTGFKPIVLSAWGPLRLRRSKGLQRLLIKYALKKADMVLVHSRVLEQTVIDLGASPEKIRIFSWGIDLDEFNPQRDSTRIQKELKLSNCPVVISMRSFEPVYNVECLINAIPLVLEQIPNVKFVIVGTGSLEHNLKQMARDLGVFDSVRFTGYVTHEKIPQYLCASDVYVSTSLADGGSASLFEAMACGLPVVVTDIPANREYIRDGWSGYIVPGRSSKSLAERIVGVLKNSEKKRSFGKRNYKFASEMLNQKKSMKEIEKLYESLMKKY
jgi:glycosyltransferase involved in cell wall biosynthesis